MFIITIKPINDNIIIKIKEEEENVTKSGITIITKEQNITNEGTVVATGRGRVLQNGDILPTAVNNGDSVLFSQHAGTIIKVEEEEFLLLKENDILAVL